MGALVGSIVGLSDLVINFAKDFDDASDNKDSWGRTYKEDAKIGNSLWRSVKRSFKRGICTMAAVGAVKAGASAAMGLSRDLR